VIDTAAVAIMTDSSQLLKDGEVGKRLGWKSISYDTKEDAFGEKLEPDKTILLKLERQNDGFALVKKGHSGSVIFQS
jgi:hypothetical protein